MRAILLMAVFLVAACGSVDDVHLRHPETGEIAICNGATGLNSADRRTMVIEQRGCIEDFKEQGFQRVSESDT